MLLPGGFKYLLLGVVLGLGLLGIIGPAWAEEKSKGSQSPQEVEELSRDPFSLPAGVKFLKKEKDEKAEASPLQGWKEGMVASRVDGIFQGDKKAMAVINGVWVEEGGLVGEEKVVEIKKDKVILADKKGEKRVLPLFKEIGLKVTEWIKPKSEEKK